MRPFCHLVISGIRHDSPPLTFNRQTLSNALLELRLHAGLTQETLASRLNASLRTLQNWERDRTKPNSRFWPGIRALLTRFHV